MAKDFLLKSSSFFVDVNGFILVHVVFNNIKNQQKEAYWMPLSVYESIKNPTHAPLSSYEKLMGHELPRAPLLIDSLELPELALEIAGDYFVNPDTLKIKKLLALGQ